MDRSRKEFKLSGVDDFVDIQSIVQFGLMSRGLSAEMVAARRQKFSLLMISSQSRPSLNAREQARLAMFESTPEPTEAILFTRQASAEQIAATVTKVVTRVKQIDRTHTEINAALIQQVAHVLPMESYIAQSREATEIITEERADAYGALAVLIDQYSPADPADQAFINDVNAILSGMDWSDAEAWPTISQTLPDPLDYAGTSTPRYYFELATPPIEETAVARLNLPG
jgi:hypothetical protein